MNSKVGSPGGALPSSVAVLIIGAGAGGLCAGIELLRAGISDFMILEKANGVGGTWRHNRYPGAECDVESHLYSYAFAPKPDWSKPYAGQPEIRAYIEHVAETHGILPYCRFGIEVASARWDEAAALWRVATSDGRQIRARIVVSAIGMFNEIATPDIPGLELFGGDVFHTARWPEGYDIRGRRVALIAAPQAPYRLGPRSLRSFAISTFTRERRSGCFPSATHRSRHRRSSAFGMSRMRCGLTAKRCGPRSRTHSSLPIRS